MRVALFVNEWDWQARALLRAFTELGARPARLRLAECAFDTTAPFGLRLPGFGDGLPDAVFVRAVAGGGFEEVTRRLGVLHGLGGLGVRIWNSASAIERCVDKSMTSFLLARARVPTPASWAVEGSAAARALVVREARSGPLVLKPLFGSRGRGLRLIHRPEDLPEQPALTGVYYFQRFVPTMTDGLFQDYRLLVCAGAVLAAMTRRAENWVTNIGRGGRPEPLEPDEELSGLALAAAEAVGAAYAGVDLVRDRNGKAQVIEVNSMPGWRGLQSVTAHSIARQVAQAVLAAR